MSDAYDHRAGRPGLWVFAILMAGAAFFWHGRDWNSASRLMLTYAIVDRGTIVIDGLEDQTGDRALVDGRFYSDKLPGFSLLAAPPYAAAKGALGLPDHPLKQPGFAYWEADYWATLGTSGLLTAWAAAIVVGLALELGCGSRQAALVGLAYGLGTHAYAYATLAYGHQASAFALIASFALLWRPDRRRQAGRAALAGVLAAYAAVIELQVGPVSAILGFFLLAQVLGGRRPPSAIAWFGLGAAGPTLLLLGYNLLAFGSPVEMGYFHHATKRFAEVHSEQNPLGLVRPDLDVALELIVGERRGLLFYAPIVLLAAPGLVALLALRRWGTAAVSLAVMAAVFLVNVSYPEWTGGWSTGPRFLLPMLPFAMLPVAALLAAGPGWLRAGWTTLAALLALAGALVMLVFKAVGSGVPETVASPFVGGVWPVFLGGRLPDWALGGRFARNLVNTTWPEAVAGLPVDRQWVQFAPLVLVQAVLIAGMLITCRPRRADAVRPPSD